MRRADLLITKAGGMTLAEAACVGVPLLLVHSLPGQERGNTEVMVHHGAALHVTNEHDIPRSVSILLENQPLLATMRDKALDAMLEVEHIEYLQQCRAMGKGIIALTAHIGNWELGTAVLDRNGCRVNAVVREQPSARLDRLFQSQRIRRGIHPLSMANAAVSVSACLKRNELVAILADLDFSRGGARRVPFFGKPARLPRGPAVLAKRSGAPILPAFVPRQADDTFRFRAYPPIVPDRSQSVDDIQASICAVMETVIGAHPDQWFAFEPLWA